MTFEKDGVVPDVLDAVPPKVLHVEYADGLVVTPGIVITPTQAQSQPTVKYDAEPEAYYTLVKTDPDAPSRANPIYGQWCHWIVANIPGSDISKGEPIWDYVGAGAPKDTGLHRYVFVLYKQPQGKITVNLPKKSSRSAAGRNNWHLGKFAEEHGLGAPIAATFYQAQWDEYVPKLYASFQD